MGRQFRPLQLRVNGRSEPVVGFVDSGADLTLISNRVAKLLHARIADSEEVVVANGQVIDVGLTNLRLVSPWEGADCRMRVGVSDIPFDWEMDKVDVILGLDYLQANRIRLDFGEGTRKRVRAAMRSGGRRRAKG